MIGKTLSPGLQGGADWQPLHLFCYLKPLILFKVQDQDRSLLQLDHPGLVGAAFYDLYSNTSAENAHATMIANRFFRYIRLSYGKFIFGTYRVLFILDKTRPFIGSQSTRNATPLLV